MIWCVGQKYYKEGNLKHWCFFLCITKLCISLKFEAAYHEWLDTSVTYVSGMDRINLVDATNQYAESVLNFHFSMESIAYSNSSAISKDVLRQKYVENRLSMRDIAKEFMCSKTQVRNLLLKHDIPLREPSKYHKDHTKLFFQQNA